MKRNGRPKLVPALVTVVFVITLFAGGVALAQGGYKLSRGTVAGGGTSASTGGSYSLGGSIGQLDAGAMSGGDYTLDGGFWGGGGVQPSSPTYRVYLPITLKN